MAPILLWTLVAVVGTAIIWWGSGLLERASERLSAYYQLPDIVQGAIVVAVGSSFPELSTTVISTLLHGEFELGVAAIVGSALFNILVIPALSGLTSRHPLTANRDLVYKEAQFYMIAVAVLTLTFSFAAIYHPSEGSSGVIQGELTPLLALIPIALYGLYLFVQYQDTLEHESDVDASDIRPGREWLRLGLSLLVIVIGVEALVQAALNFGEIFDTPSFLWGITVVAAGTSIPDAFVSVRAARQGRGITSIANVLGSNTFDLLVCIPAGVLIAGGAMVNFSIAAPMMAALTAATVALFLMMRTRMVLSKPECVVLLALYLGFIVWIGAESFGALDWVPHLPPA
ncbi:sodium:calcium antiporter [Halomonas elongata]|uniref:NCKX family transport protein n=1 Tax=Halomonas elongata (strain ATCC 33173 / DSM 2581 / NBRC 15536 / NCIMB 2198 / 1H9) TaxID=768066 RepID=E1VA92_HALED|nr:sodium:calcium antiporter [Halomonas elongata]WBF19182.1 sodium:calcium antiporter [Halomonas elongata]WPU48042.1 sodium:calcium antiporter [Halomonas elongata DSM 2581]WVI72683.1 sodium:calcium antiporter [Halomonas elongata]CBV41938.1 NCKX family transport protein [Halomonas elongata DSM 2581]